jgi:ActD protein
MTPSGLMGTFTSLEDFAEGLKKLRSQGFHQIEAITPQEIEGLEEIFGHSKRSRLYSICGLVGAITGLIGGFLMQWYASVEQTPLDVGGRPLNSWPSFVPIVYILTILGAALFLTVAFFIDLRLPCPAHPLFRTSLDLSKNNFMILISAQDALFDPKKTPELLRQLKATAVEEVP